jgi:protein ImuA
MNPTPTDTSDTCLEQLLKRNDIWRGNSRALVPQLTLDTGYAELNAALLNGGWPVRSLVEICQKGLQQQEWLLFSPTLKASTGYIVLLNPPAIPFCQALIQADIDLERVIIVKVANKADFLASFVELARTESCEVLLAWQQQQTLGYTELRKCLLATQEASGLCTLFRPESAQQQSSPASLRLLSEITPTAVQLTIFKQKGVLQQHKSEAIILSLPAAWKGLQPYHLLDETKLAGHTDAAPGKRKLASILPIKRGKR